MKKYCAIQGTNTSWKLMLLLVCTFLFATSACSEADSKEQNNSEVSENKATPFVQGKWIEKDFVDLLKSKNFNKAWPSIDNATGFSTYLNSKGKPKWTSVIPDNGGELSDCNGKWCKGDSPIIEFYVDGNDTLAKYFVSAAEFGGKGGKENPRIYVRVPCESESDSDVQYVSEQCVYYVHYFSGKYHVVNSKGIESEIELLANGKIKGSQEWSSYFVNTVNSQPVFSLETKAEEFVDYVISGTQNGFILFQMMNQGPLEGDGNEIEKGPQLYDFQFQK